jgi:hypothetical protein
LGDPLHEEVYGLLNIKILLLYKQSDLLIIICGWLLSVNKNFLTSEDVADRYFGMELGYDKGGSQSLITAQYNGNIAGMIWKSQGDQVVRKCDFGYDVANRLLKADFSDPSGGMNFGMTVGNGADPDQAIKAASNMLHRSQVWICTGNHCGRAVYNFKCQLSSNASLAFISLTLQA